jgi:hypothetical protein
MLPWRTLPLVLALAPLVHACEPEIPEGRFACTADEDCPPGLVCRTNVARCYASAEAERPPPDGGPADAGP